MNWSKRQVFASAWKPRSVSAVKYETSSERSFLRLTNAPTASSVSAAHALARSEARLEQPPLNSSARTHSVVKGGERQFDKSRVSRVSRPVASTLTTSIGSAVPLKSRRLVRAPIAWTNDLIPT